MNKKIIVVNDDGVNSIGIDMLARAFMKYGEVIVYAPKYQQSAKSQSISFPPKKIEKVEGRAYECYSIDATPADCVRIVCGIRDDIDFIVSGLNDGLNLGNDVRYSGTCGAALEANLHNISSFAFSANMFHLADVKEEMLDYSIKEALNYAKKIEGKLFCLNVNLPYSLKEVKGTIITKMGYFNDVLVMVDNGEGYTQGNYQGIASLVYEGGLEIDFNAVMAEYLSITPLTNDQTDNEIYKILKK